MIRVIVSVEGKEDKSYRNVKEAFEDLGLPMAGHIRFRGQLREELEKTFSYDDKNYKFKVVV